MNLKALFAGILLAGLVTLLSGWSSRVLVRGTDFECFNSASGGADSSITFDTGRAYLQFRASGACTLYVLSPSTASGDSTRIITPAGVSTTVSVPPLREGATGATIIAGVATSWTLITAR